MGFFDGFGSVLSNLFSSGPEQLSGPGMDSGFNFDWGNLASGFADLGKSALPVLGSVAGAALPALGSIGAGMLIDKAMPGTPEKVNLVDPRQPQTIAGANMALERAKALQEQPTSFGLPGDPNDPSTPAGKKRYDIIQGSRAADAARGMFSTGGSAARETNALNQAVGNEYNRIFQDTMGTLSGQPSMTGYVSPAQANPWAQMLGGAVSPAVSQGLSKLLADWGMQA